MRRILSLALLSLALPFAATAQQTDAAPAKPPGHGTPQGGQDNAASTNAKPAAKKAAKKTAPTAQTTGDHGTPQGVAPQK